VSNLLTLKSTAVIEGEVTVSKLSIEPGATFNATCAMKTGIKELKSGGEQKAEKTA
jgi:cytoskeletal protein CcmA (bactofilin family)